MTRNVTQPVFSRHTRTEQIATTFSVNLPPLLLQVTKNTAGLKYLAVFIDFLFPDCVGDWNALSDMIGLLFSYVSNTNIDPVSQFCFSNIK